MYGENQFLLKNIKSIKGVGEAKAKLLARLGIFTLYDMLRFYPRFVENRSEIKSISSVSDGEIACISAEIYSEVKTAYIRKNMQIYSVYVRDGKDIATMSWFNNKYIKSAFKPGERYNFYGKVQKKFGKVQMTSPTYEKADKNLHTGRVVPVYPLTENLPQKTIRSVAKSCVDLTRGIISEYLPSYIREEYSLSEINHAIASIHFPESIEDYNKAKRRLAFEELLIMQLGLFRLRKTNASGSAPVINCEKSLDEFIKKIPFTLTKAQKNVCSEITKDISSSAPMLRLVQGDVGSGKTIVAFAAIYCAVSSGYQSVMMAPTSVLANQHFKEALKYFPEDEIVLLTGAVTPSLKKGIYEKIESGRAKVIIGTHALIEDDVKYKNVGLVITDEQHRFGVNQRAKLIKKGVFPHTLVMSATPIPRTLTLILYGDLDISVINEMPPGRKPVETFAVNETMRSRIDNFIDKQIQEGKQAYVVCPLVETSEKTDLESAESVYKRLKEKVFPNYNVALVYGKMKNAEKKRILEDFSAGKIDVLVSTTVIEVGINVPSASLMVIEDAHRFGLSTLHQLRGRVGRGSEKSYCILVSDSPSELTGTRLKVMCSTNDGFEIANKDLELRGPGDILGVRQHGLPEFKIANLLTDGLLLKEANVCAKKIMEIDGELSAPQHQPLKKLINKMFDENIPGGIIN